MNSRSLILAIDGGATHTVSVLADQQGAILGRGSGGPANHLLESLNKVRDSLESACSQALGTRSSGEVGIVCAGTAGIEYDGHGRREIAAILYGIFPHAEIMATADTVIALEGALAQDEGIVAIAGTGSVILGRDWQGRLVKVGGWGPFYGNEGSGEFVIREALRAAARECDGRGPSTRLTEAICRSLQLKDFSESIAEIYREGVQWQKVVPLGAVVASVAQKGDEVAREIFQRAALELVVGLQAAARRLSLKPPVAISYQGSLFKAGEVLLEPLRKQLQWMIPEAELSPPLMPSVGGAYSLARTRLGKKMTPEECREFGRRLEGFEKTNHQDTKAPSGC